MRMRITHLRGHPLAVPVSGPGQQTASGSSKIPSFQPGCSPLNLKQAPRVLRIGGVLGRFALPNYGLEELQGGEGVTSGKHSAMCAPNEGPLLTPEPVRTLT